MNTKNFIFWKEVFTMTKKEKIEKVNAAEQAAEQTAEQAAEHATEQATEQATEWPAEEEWPAEQATEWPAEEEWPAEQATEQAAEQTIDDTDLLYETGKGDGIASEKLVNLTKSVKVLKEIQKRSDYGIAFALNLINKHHKEEIKRIGYKNVEDYAYSNFNYSKSTFHNYVKIAERFITPRLDVRKAISSNSFEITSIMTNDSFTVLEDVDGYSFSISQMLEMLPLTDDEIETHLEEFSAGDTTKSIRNKVNAIRSAIATTATDTEEQAAEQVAEQAAEAGAEGAGAVGAGAGAGAGTGNAPSDDTSRILAILEIVNKLENEEIRNKLVDVINSVINS